MLDYDESTESSEESPTCETNVGLTLQQIIIHEFGGR